MSIDFRIMAVRSRREKYILPMLETLKLPEEIVFYDIDRPKAERNAMKNAKRTWLAPTSASHVCVLQDDLLLAPNFVDIAEECAKQFPSAIFSFYQPRLNWSDKAGDTPYVKINGCGMYGQAIMIPAKLVPLVFFWGDKNYGEDYPHDDTVIGFFASVNHVPVMATIPCPIQHLGCSDSALGYNNKNKVSKVFSESIDLEQFKTNKYVTSKYIPNTAIPPKGGYLCGSLQELKDLL